MRERVLDLSLDRAVEAFEAFKWKFFEYILFKTILHKKCYKFFLINNMSFPRCIFSRYIN